MVPNGRWQNVTDLINKQKMITISPADIVRPAAPV
jgi:hypothetical protein